MKTSEFKQFMKESGLEIQNWDDGIAINQYLAINEKTKIAFVGNKYPFKINIYRPELLDEKIANSIIDYAKTPIDERKDEIKATFVPNEIKFAKKFLESDGNIEYKPAIAHCQTGEYKFTMYGMEDYKALLNIMVKVSGGEVKW